MYANFWIKAGCLGHSPSFPLAGKRQQLEPSRCPVLEMAERPHGPRSTHLGAVMWERNNLLSSLGYCTVESFPL